MLDVSVYFLCFPINLFVLKATCEQRNLQYVKDSGKMRAFRFVISTHLCDSFVSQITSFIVRRQSFQKNSDEYLTEVRSFKSAASIIIIFFAFRLGELQMLGVTGLLLVQLNNKNSSVSPELPRNCT